MEDEEVVCLNLKTSPLTEVEKLLIDPIIKILRNRIGKVNAVSASIISDRLSSWMQENRQFIPKTFKLNDQKLKKIIDHIRQFDKISCLISNSKGYYIASNQEEVNEELKEIRQKIHNIQVVHDHLEQQSSMKFKIKK